MRIYLRTRRGDDIVPALETPVTADYAHELAHPFDRALFHALISAQIPAPDGYEVIVAAKFGKSENRFPGRANDVFSARDIPLYLMKVATQSLRLIVELSFGETQDAHESNGLTHFQQVLFDLVREQVAIIVTDSNDAEERELFEEFHRRLCNIPAEVA